VSGQLEDFESSAERAVLMASPVAFCVVMTPCSEAVIALSGMFACVGAPSVGWKDMEGEK